jgi:alkylation response protein AidB-like acyl-CoA dehydrogenase
MSYRRLPVPLVTLNTVGPTIIRVGTDEQKQAYLPGILRGEVEFAIGYTEPEAGTDLASLKTAAVRDGDSYVVNGQKVFTSGAEHADYVWLAVRTDPDAPKHKGISVLIVPLSAEGVSVRPLHMMSGHGTTMTFYDNVRVPLSSCIGEENRGWYYMTTQLDFERVAIGAVPHLQRTFDYLVAYLRERGLGANGHWTRTAVAAMAADLNALTVLDLRVACMVAAGDVPVAEASMLKVLSNEARVTMCANALQILGSDGLVRRGSPGALADASGGTIERQLRESVINLFGGGSNDIQRDLMATHALGLPR